MGGVALTVVVGLVSGVLSGAFGIGGGLVTTPAIRLLLGYPALIAVGTPLPVILPGAIAGASSYVRRGLADVRAGARHRAWSGRSGSVAGALLSAARRRPGRPGGDRRGHGVGGGATCCCRSDALADARPPSCRASRKRTRTAALPVAERRTTSARASRGSPRSG